jgi:SDR family mycofactocin-dependent oxidoreductase
MTTQRLLDRVAFVTGAARGQGRAHAVRLAEEGADVVVLDICAPVASVTDYAMAGPDDLDETVALVEKTGRRCRSVVADVRDLEAVTAGLADAVAELGRLDVVVANAGIASYGRGWELTPDQWADMIGINLTGVWNTLRAAIPHIRAGGRGGSIVITSSIGGLKGLAHVAHYAAAKHGVVGLMRSFSAELAPYGVRVNTVNPTNVDTEMVQNAGTYGMFLPGDPDPTREKATPSFAAMHPMGIPWVEVSDVANAVAFLASDEARYITGIALPIDAGVTQH